MYKHITQFLLKLVSSGLIRNTSVTLGLHHVSDIIYIKRDGHLEIVTLRSNKFKIPLIEEMLKEPKLVEIVSHNVDITSTKIQTTLKVIHQIFQIALPLKCRNSLAFDFNYKPTLFSPLCPFSKSKFNLYEEKSLTASTLFQWLVLLIVFFINPMSVWCSTNWDRKG